MSDFKTFPVRNTDRQGIKKALRFLRPRPLSRSNNNKGKHWCEDFFLHQVKPWFKRFK